MVDLVLETGCIFLTLLFHKKSNPSLPPLDPATAARLEEKLRLARVDKAAGKPSVISLDEKEVNALLARVLQAKLRQAEATGRNFPVVPGLDFPNSVENGTSA